MGVTWTPTEVNMGHEGKNASAGLPRDFHGSPMEVLWKSDGNPMEVSWESYGSPMEAGSIMEAPWKHHGSTTEANGSPDCKHYGSTMETRLRHNGTMEIPWRHHESPVGVRLKSHESTTGVPWKFPWKHVLPWTRWSSYGVPIEALCSYGRTMEVPWESPLRPLGFPMDFPTYFSMGALSFRT